MTRSLSRTRTVAAGAVLALLAAPLAVPSTAAAADPVVLTLLGINDFHGRIDANTVKFAGTIEQQRAAAGADRTLLVSAGDNIGASLFASASQQDQPTIDVLDAVGLRASAVGNHELDKGFDDLVNRVIGDPRNATWDYLGANVTYKSDGSPALDRYTVVDVGGIKVGVVGAITQEAPTLVSPAGISMLDFGDPVAAVNAATADLTDGDAANGEADVVVATFHEGAPEGTRDGATLEQEVAQGGAFARIVQDLSPKVAAIFTGHTHKEYAWDAPVPGGAGTRPVIQTGEYGSNVGRITLSVDPDSKAVTAHTVANVPRTTAADADLVAAYPRVAQVKMIVDDALAKAAVIGNQPVGRITADITTAFSGDRRDDRSSESTLGDLVADVLRDRLDAPDLGSAEIGVVNPGGLRADLLYAGDTTSNPVNTDGVVTYAEANAVLPFVNNLWTVTLTGAQFTTLLEQQWQTTTDNTPPARPYLQLGLSRNVTYTYDADAAQGHHITSVTVNGAPLDPAKDYRIGTFSFLTSGGDNFRVFREGTDAQDTGLVDRDAWIGYLQDHAGAGEAISPDFARQAVQVTDLPTTVDPGEQVAFGLARLDLTSLGSPTNTSVDVSLELAGGAPIDYDTYPVSDGAARIELTAPDAPGRYTLVATASPSGTTVRVPLTVDKVTPRITATTRRVTYGQAASVHVTVDSVPPATGQVSVYAGTRRLGTASLAGGEATVRLARTALKPGTYRLTVRYGGNADVRAATTTVTLTVAKAPATVRATVRSSKVTVDKTRARVRVTVTTSTGVPARGTLRIYFHGNVVGKAAITDGVAKARLEPFGKTGAKMLRAYYAGSSTVSGDSDRFRLRVTR